MVVSRCRLSSTTFNLNSGVYCLRLCSIGSNTFHFSPFPCSSVHYTRYWTRADVVFLINGIPVALAETKKAGLHDGLAIGVDQVRRYHRETPEMLITPQVFEVTQLLDFFYG